MNIFVGNLAFEVTEADLRRLFEVFGEVAVIKLLMHKKGIKNRGFGFVEMPDDAKAQAAMSSLSGQDFMGRPLKLSPARPKPEKIVEVTQRKEKRHGFSPEGRNFHYEEGTRRDIGFKPEFPKPGTFKGGRRSRSYVARNPDARQDERASFGRRTEFNPMRWPKKSSGQAKPWHKPSGESKPWHKPRGEAKPWERAKEGARPPRRTEGAQSAKPWHKPSAEAKPWRKPRGEYKPWERAKEGARPARRTEGAPAKKPWHKAARPMPRTGLRLRKKV
ncbi:MAG: hypothetical protein NTY47_00575 [Candidatus Omnitrophica bacterium]|nr:hypothetical protein [Candidatus Omnitrophota bacterium]